MITRKQKRSILYILFVFILCSAAKDFEFLVLKTDETFLAENIFCKIFAILVISQCLVERKLSWRSIGFRLKGIKKGLILGFSLGLSTFAISYLPNSSYCFSWENHHGFPFIFPTSLFPIKQSPASPFPHFSSVSLEM